MKYVLKDSPAGKLAKQLSYPENQDDSGSNEGVVLVELNHFFAHHCGLPAVIRALRSEKKYRFVPYIPLVGWEIDHPTLEIVQAFYECMGIEEKIVKATPSVEHIEKAKLVVIDQITLFQGKIWNLTDLEYDGLPIGVHLVETLLQQFQSAEFHQNIDTVAYSVGLIARYLWWKDWLVNEQVKYIVASHVCYEFVLPQLAGLTKGVASYVWHDNFLFYSNDMLPLPLISHAWNVSARKLWQSLDLSDQKRLVTHARQELTQRTLGQRVGLLKNDPRFIKADHQTARDEFQKSQKKRVIVYLHAFSDAPCTLPKASHGSLCSPLVATRKLLKLLGTTDLEVFIKTHPKPFEQDELAINKLLAENPSVTRLPSHLSPMDIKNLGADLIISGWGSICLEASFIGIKVIAYSNFSEFLQSGEIKIINLDDEKNSLLEIKKALGLGSSNVSIDDLVEKYAILNYCSQADLTCANTAILDREGVSGRYSPYAYRYWVENIDRGSFTAIARSLSNYFTDRGSIFSQITVPGGINKICDSSA